MSKARERYALISVANKDGIVEFARKLVDMGWGIISSGGTAKALVAAEVPVTSVAELRYKVFEMRLERAGWNLSVTNRSGMRIPRERFFRAIFPTEMLSHRVATLHAEVHGGILAADDMLRELESLSYPLIDLVCIDFYDLEGAISEPDATLRSICDKIDIGGPTALAGAAKNLRICVNTVEQREVVIEQLAEFGDVDDRTRRALAGAALETIGEYRTMSGFYIHSTLLAE